ncbi:hypothetical protein SAMN05660816_06408 [Niastella yeongjuensis]|nr:hypothetical protein SAMN05660816_06408 [Niastella yeongjuensis]
MSQFDKKQGKNNIKSGIELIQVITGNTGTFQWLYAEIVK